MKARCVVAVIVIMFVLNMGCSSGGGAKGKRNARPAPPRRNLPIDQVPMYGELDRPSVPELKTADDWFVANTAAKFGGREPAAAAWVEQGFRLFKENDLYTAMQRFNEAWLLDPKNAEVYWGFGCVLNERGKAFDAYDMLKRAYDLGLRDSGFVADLGRVSLMRIVERKDLAPQQRQQFIGESEGFYADAVKSEDNLAYVYESWAFSRYAQEDYAGAWEKVGEARKQGGVVSPRLIEMLEEKGETLNR